MSLHRVVITGLGLQSPLGSLVPNDANNGVSNGAGSNEKSFFTRLCVGETGIRRHPNDDIFTPVGWVDFDAPLEVWAAKKTLTIPAAMTHAPASQIALDLGVRGECQTYSTACSSAAVAIGEAFRRIQHGYLTTAIAGGADCMIYPCVMQNWSDLGVLCDAPIDAIGTGCRPFSANRTGFAIGEAAGVLVLERLDTATARGATVIAELVGYGVSNDATHITKPNPAGQALAMRRAIACAGIAPTDIGYINAHGTATGAGDVAETQSIKAVFGDHAYQLAVSSTKSAHGHCMGGTAAVEFIATVLALQHQIIPPTTHYDVPDPDCDLDYVPHRGRTVPADKPLRYAASNAFAFGGNNAVLIAKRWGAYET